MKTQFLALGGVLLLGASPLSAQNLTWFGTSACFTSASSSPANTHSIDSCNLSSSTYTRIRWDNADYSWNRSQMEFQVNEYNNTGTSNDWPGGPASSSTNRLLSFGSVGDTRHLYLGYFNFDDNSGTNLLYTYLSMNLHFNGGSASYIDKFKITYLEGSNDQVRLESSPWMQFAVGGHKYSFKVAGFDSPWDDENKNYCRDGYYDNLPEVLPEDGRTNGKLCGQIKYDGAVTVTPEPSTYVLMTAGLLGVGVVSRRRRRIG